MCSERMRRIHNVRAKFILDTTLYLKQGLASSSDFLVPASNSERWETRNDVETDRCCQILARTTRRRHRGAFVTSAPARGILVCVMQVAPNTAGPHECTASKCTCSCTCGTRARDRKRASDISIINRRATRVRACVARADRCRSSLSASL